MTDETARKSAIRIILIDGLLIRGGFFILWYVVGGFLFDRIVGRATSFTEYVAARATWTDLGFLFVAFGLFVGVDQWIRVKGLETEQHRIT